MNYSILRKLLFQMNPEIAHKWSVTALKILQTIPVLKGCKISDNRLRSRFWNLSFPNPIGLAAGFDKDASIYAALAMLGFGFVEVGTLTPFPQLGNARPRLFRVAEQKALINRMGFNNKGIEEARKHFIKLRRPDVPIGINLGKNKETPNSQANEDYCQGLHKLYLYGDYFVINISSPNTKGLRDLQEIDSLNTLLESILIAREVLTQKYKTNKPILVKVSPDLQKDQLIEITKLILSIGIDGIIVSNTTLSREGIKEREVGGLSGKPLEKISTECIRTVYSVTQNKIPIIGVGGVFTGEDAYRKIRAGANLIQIYTSFIYRGPFVSRKINKEILELLEKDGISSIQEAVGLD